MCLINTETKMRLSKTLSKSLFMSASFQIFLYICLRTEPHLEICHTQNTPRCLRLCLSLRHNPLINTSPRRPTPQKPSKPGSPVLHVRCSRHSPPCGLLHSSLSQVLTTAHPPCRCLQVRLGSLHSIATNWLQDRS